MRSTLSRSTNSWALVLAPAGAPPVSAEMKSTLRPAIVYLVSFKKVSTPCSIWMPPWASGPTFTVRRPILIGAVWAIAGAGKELRAAAAPVLARSVRRLTLRDIISSEKCPSHFVRALARFIQSFGWLFLAFGRNDWKQQIGRAAEMQSGNPAEDLWRPIARIVVHERSAAGQFVLEIRQPSAAPSRINVILATDGQRDAIGFGHDDRRRPNFDIERDDFPRLEWLFFIVGVIRPIRPRQFFVELTMRSAQPTLADRCVWIDRALKHDLFQIRREHAQHDKNIGVCC